MINKKLYKNSKLKTQIKQAQASITEEAQKGKRLKKRGLNITILSSFNNNKFFKRIFAIFNLSTANIMGSKIKDTYQDTIKNA